MLVQLSPTPAMQGLVDEIQRLRRGVLQLKTSRWPNCLEQRQQGRNR